MFVIPMMGRSSRFFNAGYTLPKFQLPLGDGTVFDYVVESFAGYFESDCFVFVVRDEFDAEEFVRQSCLRHEIENFRIMVLDTDTSGQAETVDIALQHASAREPIYVYNADSFRPSFTKPEFAATADGVLDVFLGEGDHWSFVEPVDDSRVARTTEKVRVSDLCSDGMYYFGSVELFKSAYALSADSVRAEAGETYVAPLYNGLIAAGLDIRYRLIDRAAVQFCGTPAEYEGLLASGFGMGTR